MQKSYTRRMKSLILGTLATSILMFPVSIPEVQAQSYIGETILAPDVAVVQTRSGKIQGYIHDGIFNYKGVQYARAERFQTPQPVEPWNGIKTAITYGFVAPQFTDQAHDIFPPHWFAPHWLPRNLPQSDDCQNLNIWTPALNSKKRPVMVWLHGGGFSMGSASVEDVYDGENLSRKGDIVVVSVNHRLNSLGFLDLSAYGEEYRDSGNLGMLDIVAALQWIHDNIEKFGGDPNNVTLFGQSGGGSKNLTLTAMPSAQGLFHKAIVQSGAVELMGMSLPRQDITRRIAEITLQNLKIAPNEIEKLKSVPYEEFAVASEKAYLQAGDEFGGDRMFIGTSGWSPVVDGRVVTQDPVVDGFSAQSRNIPLLIGCVANEWMTIDQWANMSTNQTDNKNNWSDSEIQRRLREKYGDNAQKILDAFRKAYPDKSDGNALFIDTWFRTRSKKTASIKSDQSAPVYNYIFTWETPVMGGFGMAYHCAEIPFVFNNIDKSGMATGATKDAYKLADKISQT